MNVAIVQCATPEAYFEKVQTGVELTQRYAQRQGYDYLFFDHMPFEMTKHVSWYKLKLVQQCFEGYDWLFWLDADTVIMDHNRRLEEFLNTEKDFVFSHGIIGKVCAGVWFTRTTDRAKEQLNRWFDGIEGPQGWLWEEFAVNADLNPEYVEINDRLAGMHRLNGWAKRDQWYTPGKHWIAHIAGRNYPQGMLTEFMERYAKSAIL